MTRAKPLMLALSAVAVLALAGCAVDPMEKLAQDIDSQDLTVKQRAVVALANLKDDRAADSLVEVLQDEDLCDQAGVALVKKGREVPEKKKPNPVVEAVGKVCANTHLLETTRARACWVLGEIGDREAVPTLKGLVADTMVGVADQSKKALEKLGYYSASRAYDIAWGELSQDVTVIKKPPPVVKPAAKTTAAK
jgi:HEAT repeat protein